MINIAVLGYGTVGKGTVDLIDENRDLIEKRVGKVINVKYIVDLRDFSGDRNEKKLTKDYNAVLADKDVSIVCEMIGGSHPAFEFTMKAFAAGKSVVTSNKEVVSNFGITLLKGARKNNVSYMFEASVGGGIPIISPLKNCLNANKITKIDAIVNGTTNYILTKMFEDGFTFENALCLAQGNGYAESNPAADVDGIDSARKLSILAAVCWGVLVPPDKIYTRGIRDITDGDVAAAGKIGCTIKLISHTACDENGNLEIFVSPCMVRKDNMLSDVSGVFNGVSVYGNYVGETFFYGKGAGSDPTASAVCSDVIAASSGICQDKGIWEEADNNKIKAFEDIKSTFCVIDNDSSPYVTDITTLRQMNKTSEGKRIFMIL